MSNRTKDNFVLIILGLGSVILAIGVSEGFRRFSASSVDTRSAIQTPTERPADRATQLASDFKDFRASTEKKLKELEFSGGADQNSTSTILEHLPAKDEAETHELSINEQISDVVGQSQNYLSRHQFVVKEHNVLLGSLFRLYGVKGLSHEQNNLLLASIQMMNDLGVQHAEEIAGTASPKETQQYLSEFIRSTQYLSPQQTAKLSARLKTLDRQELPKK